ncbi:MAG: DUF2191 domain-containing protein [Deltaproteobacteria bacterium]|nr:DUF2191 domain-containing protein [Deltaproteobacteria bacterium]
MKTTIDVSDELLARVKRRARKVGKPLRVLFEEGLRLVLDGASEPTAYVLPDFSLFPEMIVEDPFAKRVRRR